MYLATLDCATSNPSLSSSPWMRGAPHGGFSILIRRIKARSSALFRKLNADGVMAWRKRFRAKIEAISELYPPKQKLDVDALADMAATLVEGGLVIGRLLQDMTVLP